MSQMISRPNKRNQLKFSDVIARRAQPDVAISWYGVQICTKEQEIATACGLAMTEGTAALICAAFGMFESLLSEITKNPDTQMGIWIFWYARRDSNP